MVTLDDINELNPSRPYCFENDAEQNAYDLGLVDGKEVVTDHVIREVERRIAILKDQLIGQSPENLERHYKLIGKKNALESLLKYMQEL